MPLASCASATRASAAPSQASIFRKRRRAPEWTKATAAAWCSSRKASTNVIPRRVASARERHGPARERRELEEREREEGEAGKEKRPAGEGRLAQVDRPAERAVGRVRLDHQPAAGHVEGDVVRAEPLPQAPHRHRARERDRGREEAGDPEDRVGPGVDGAEGQDGARDDEPQRRLERALQPAHDARRAQQVGRGDGDGASLRGFAHGAGDDTTRPRGAT